MNLETILLVAAGTTTSLIAGLFFAFHTTVNQSVGRLKDEPFMIAWKAINDTIMNPVFLSTFMAPVILLPIVTFLYRGEAAFGFLVAASILYIFGTFGVTMSKNVPLNEQIVKFNLAGASSSELSELRARYEKPWIRFNTVRTTMSFLATVLIFVACVVR